MANKQSSLNIKSNKKVEKLREREREFQLKRHRETNNHSTLNIFNKIPITCMSSHRLSSISLQDLSPTTNNVAFNIIYWRLNTLLIPFNCEYWLHALGLQKQHKRKFEKNRIKTHPVMILHMMTLHLLSQHSRYAIPTITITCCADFHVNSSNSSSLSTVSTFNQSTLLSCSS